MWSEFVISWNAFLQRFLSTRLDYFLVVDTIMMIELECLLAILPADQIGLYSCGHSNDN